MTYTRIRTCLARGILLACLFSGMVSAATETLPLTVTPGLNSLEWIVTNTGGTDTGTAFAGTCDGSAGMSISEATSANGATDAFDNAWMLFLDGVIFAAPANVDLTGETFTAGPVVLSGLNVSLEILFSGSVQAARILAIFENPTINAITVDVDVPINLGSDVDTLVERTASGDNLFTTGDRWIITSDNNVGLKAVNTTVIYGPGNPDATPLAVTSSVCNDSVAQPEGIGFSFNITIPANKTRSLMFFAGLGDIEGINNTITGAIANAAMFNSNDTIDTRLLNGLSISERLEILNWDFAATIDDAVVDANEDRNFIDDFIGCSLGSSKTKDPTLLLLALFALAGLVRMRGFALMGEALLFTLKK
jgi:hypothetical protein